MIATHCNLLKFLYNPQGAACFVGTYLVDSVCKCQSKELDYQGAQIELKQWSNLVSSSPESLSIGCYAEYNA